MQTQTQIKTFKRYIDLAIWLVIVLSCLYILKGQPSYPFVTPPPPAVQQVSTNVVGNQGNQTYYYFVVARYPIGQAQPSQGTITRNAPVTLSVTNFVLITWNPPQGATGFDVIRLRVPNLTQICIDCLIASNTTNTSVSDISNATLGNYILSNAPGASAIEYLDNLTGTIPTIRLDGVNGQNIAFAPGATINVDFGGANNTKPAKVVTALPAASGIVCIIGSLQFYTLATAGANLYACASGTGYTAVNGTGSSTNTKLCNVGNVSGAVILDYTLCAVIEATITGNITSLTPLGQSVNSTFGGVVWIQGGAGGFTIAGVDASLVGWCSPQLVATKHTIQSFIYDGTASYSSGCVDSDTISNTIVINGFTYTFPGLTTNLSSGIGTTGSIIKYTTGATAIIGDAAASDIALEFCASDATKALYADGTCKAVTSSPFSTTTLSGSDNFGNWFAFGTVLASQLGWNYANTTPAIGSTTTGTGVNITDTGIGIDAYLASTASAINPTLWANAKRVGVMEGSDNLNTNSYHFGIGRAGNIGAPCVRSCAVIQYTQGTDTNWRFIACDDAFNCTNRDTGTPFVAATKFRMYLRAGTAGTVFACANDITTDSVIGNTCNVAEVNITGSTLSSIAGPVEFGVHQGSITAATIIAWFAGFLNNPGF